MPDWLYIIFFFALGACIGSFLNVVVWRLPRGQSLVSPPSRCPVCHTGLAWFDNIPVFGWLMLRGRCRYCHNPISVRYPVVEFVTGGLFVLYYVMFFIVQEGPRAPGTGAWFVRNVNDHWTVYLLYMFAVCCMLAASLIDAELFEIPQSIPLWMAGIGFLYHAILDRWNMPGATLLDPRGIGSLMALGGTIGLIVALVLLWLGLLPRSFAQGYPMLEAEKNPPPEPEPGALSRLMNRLVDAYRRRATKQQQVVMDKRKREAEQREREEAVEAEREAAEAKLKDESPRVTEFTASDIRREMRHEMAFLMFPLGFAILAVTLAKTFPTLGGRWHAVMANVHVNGLMGSLLGALVGAFLIWLARVLGGMIAGREAMGLGDVDLMFGIGAILGAGPVTVTFFVAPFFGLLVALPKFFGGRGRELPYGPSLSFGAAVVMLYYGPIADWLTPGLSGMMQLLAGSRP